MPALLASPSRTKASLSTNKRNSSGKSANAQHESSSQPKGVPIDSALVARAEALLGQEVEFVHTEEFDQPTEAALFLVDLNESIAPTKAPRIPEGLPAYMAALYEIPLLTPMEERHLFRQFNYAKFRANQLRASLNHRRPSRENVEEIERLLALAFRIRERIARANLRLVVANARLYCDLEHVFEDLVSDGNLSLLQAIEKFDYSRGFRFSTYATHAIRRTFFRRMQRKQREKTRLAFTGPELLQDAPERPQAELPDAQETALVAEVIKRMADSLSPRELQIVQARFGFDGGENPTLQTVAKTLGICKERVRQLQNRALDKLRELTTALRQEFRDEPAMLCS